MTAPPTWEAVLDAVAEDVRRAAEVLFADRDGSATAEDYQRIVAPVTLPDVSAMPPVPDELRRRITDLRTQIAALQEELAGAIAEARRPAPARLNVGVADRPLYVDRRI
jgi:hypothetical protein